MLNNQSDLEQYDYTTEFEIEEIYIVTNDTKYKEKPLTGRDLLILFPIIIIILLFIGTHLHCRTVRQNRRRNSYTGSTQ
jgi:hypothetical protein